jgi:peptidyl-prolyl cis-trans isomerase D
MSVIQKIRDKYAGVVIAFIAISLIAFILMDAFTGRGRGGSLFGNSSTIGRVNGTKIDKRDFDHKSDVYRKAYGSNMTGDQLLNTTWNAMVESIVMEDEFEDLGLALSPKELNDILFGNNPPEWMARNPNFADPNTQMYDPARGAEFIRQLKAGSIPDGDMIEEVYINQQTIDQTLRQKYFSLLSNSTYVPKWLAEKQMNDNNAMSSIAYVYVPYASIPDTAFKPTDDQVKAYIKKHAVEYKVDEESRSVSYVSFDIKPGASDSQEVLNDVMRYRNEFQTTPDSLQEAFLARSGTEMPFANSYFAGSKIQHAYKDSIIRTGLHNVYGPYLDGNMYVLAKMLDVKTLPDSAKVRHILIGTIDPQSGTPIRPDSVAKKLADSIQNAIARGANFDSLVLKFSDDKGSNTPDKKGVYDYFPQGQMVKEFNDFAFEKPVGSKAVVKTEFGYHYMEVLGQKNPQPSYKIAYLAKSIMPGDETRNQVMESAQRFAAESGDQKEYNANLTKYNKQSLQSTDIHEYESNGGGLGDNREFVRWVFKNDLGDVSEPFDMKDRWIVAMVSNIQEKGLMNVATARKAGVDGLVIRELKAQKIIAEKFKGKTLQEFSASAGVPISRADSISFVSSTIPNIGPEAKIIGIAFNSGMRNKDSEPIAGASGVFAVRVENIGSRPSGANVQDLRRQLEGQLKGNAYATAASLKKAAKIKDYRFDFF